MGVRWELPPEGTINLCVDGSCNLADQSMGFGGLIRDSQGCWVTGFHGFRPDGNPLLSEAMALLHGLQVSWDVGYIVVICNLDCKDLIHMR